MSAPVVAVPTSLPASTQRQPAQILAVPVQPAPDASALERLKAEAANRQNAHPFRTLAQVELHEQWPLLSRLPVRVTTAIALQGFKVKDLLALRPGELVQSAWSSTSDVPFHVGDVQLGWSEFEVVEHRLAVRLTRLA